MLMILRLGGGVESGCELKDRVSALHGACRLHALVGRRSETCTRHLAAKCHSFLLRRRSLIAPATTFMPGTLSI